MGFRQWIRGDAARAEYVRSITIGLIIVFAGILAAILVYPLPFSILTVQISDLAVFRDSPIGTAIYAVCFVVAGAFFAPHATYFYKRMWRPDVKIASAISASFIFVAGIGLAMVGIFPSDVNHFWHIAGAATAFGGTFLSCVFSLFPVVKKQLRKAEWPRLGRILVPYGFLLGVAVLTILLVGVPVFEEMGAGTFNNIAPATWPLCEWLLLFSTVTWVAGMIYVSPP